MNISRLHETESSATKTTALYTYKDDDQQNRFEYECREKREALVIQIHTVRLGFRVMPCGPIMLEGDRAIEATHAAAGQKLSFGGVCVMISIFINEFIGPPVCSNTLPSD